MLENASAPKAERVARMQTVSESHVRRLLVFIGERSVEEKGIIESDAQDEQQRHEMEQ